MKDVSTNDGLDLAIVGAGPAGLAAAIEAKRRGLKFWVLEKGCLVNSIFHYPINMTFFTTADLLEIGGVPMIISSEKPKRVDGLKYYRRVVEYFDLPVRDCEAVLSVTGQEGDFRVETQPRSEEKRTYQARRVIVATGYYDNPNRLGIPGEDLAKVSHYYAEAHPYFRKKVAVIGGNNSAAESALELHRSGAEVSLIHRGEAMGKAIKYWVLPDINNRIERQEIAAYFNSRVVKIGESNITIATREGEQTLGNDAVFAMTGYHPDASFLTGIGVQVDPETLAPEHDSQTLETNVKGIFLAGSIVSGRMTNRIFIENGRFHGEQMFQHWDRAQ